MSHTIVLAGGGTAGHINPLLATAGALKERGCDVIILGTSEGLEADIVPAAGYPLETIPRVPLPRRPTKSMLTLPLRFKEAVRQVTNIIEPADLVVGFGGYVSAPAYWSAAGKKIPFIVHEQNARPGYANKLGARRANIVALTFASTPLRASRGETTVVGLPLRPTVAELAKRRSTKEGRTRARQEAAESFGLDPAKRTLLITGGSLGAQHINEVVTSVAGNLPRNAQVLHLTGRGKDTEVRRQIKSAGVEDRWVIIDYLQQMEQALALADLVVCRSGAGTVAELTALGIPALYVPLPIGNGEQRLNAHDHVEAGGAKLVADADFTAEVVDTQLFPLIVSDEITRMAQVSSELGCVDAADQLADLACGLLK